MRLPILGAERPGEAKTSGILIVPRRGVPRGEWKGLVRSLNNGAAIARFELVFAISGPTGPNGDADLGGSIGRSRHGSLGEKVGRADERVADAARGDGLNVAAFALSIRGDASGEPCGGSASSDEFVKPEDPCERVGVCVPDREGDCGRPSGVRARNEGIRVGVYGRRGAAMTEGELRAREAGVRWGAKGTCSMSSAQGQLRSSLFFAYDQPLLRCIQSRHTCSMSTSSCSLYQLHY